MVLVILCDCVASQRQAAVMRWSLPGLVWAVWRASGGEKADSNCEHLCTLSFQCTCPTLLAMLTNDGTLPALQLLDALLWETPPDTF